MSFRVICRAAWQVLSSVCNVCAFSARPHIHGLVRELLDQNAAAQSYARENMYNQARDTLLFHTSAMSSTCARHNRCLQMCTRQSIAQTLPNARIMELLGDGLHAPYLHGRIPKYLTGGWWRDPATRSVYWRMRATQLLYAPAYSERACCRNSNSCACKLLASHSSILETSTCFLACWSSLKFVSFSAVLSARAFCK